MSTELVVLAAAVALDVALGDPRWLPHPVCGFGRVVAVLERAWRPAGRWCGLRAAGAGFAVTALAAGAGFVWAALAVAASFEWLATAVSVYWVYSLLAIRGLDSEAAAVVVLLARGETAAARERLAGIVGRDTAQLDAPEILRAVLETVAENLSDAVVAPLFYFALGGPVGMALYKAANTLDSMAGYKNERYREFGWAAARFDDAMNFVPARLTALLITMAASVLRLDAGRAARTVWRDAARQPSPNAGYPEAAFAGALRVRLGGRNTYQGIASEKPWLGDAIVKMTFAVCRDARRLFWLTAAFAAAITAARFAW